LWVIQRECNALYYDLSLFFQSQGQVRVTSIY
jgi:hypothetical protein